MIKGYFSGDKVVSTSPGAFSLYEKSLLGEKRAKKVEYSSVETLYLVSSGKMEVFSGKNEIDFEGLMRKLRRMDRKIETKFAVFSNLRKKGYVVKSALKFGAEFRVYDKGQRPGKAHARWILFSVKESEQLNWYDFSAKNRVAHSTKKRLLLGVVDDEGDVTYYEVGWMKV